MQAIPYASEHGLLVRGVQPGQGAFGSALYVFDPTRNRAFYFSSFRKLQLHLAENTQAVRTPEKPGGRVRPRPKSS